MTKPNQDRIDAAMLGDAEAARECTEAGVVLPCPFCGCNDGFSIEHGIDDCGEGEKYYVLECPNCNLQIPYDGAMNTHMEFNVVSLGAWNARANLRHPAMIDGTTSDGYHTFNELYHHRAVLFSIICNAAPECAWKSKLHDDGTMFDGMFVVGIETPNGQATYHYNINPYWDMFKINELKKAPIWDGHTSDEAINRIQNINLLHLTKPRWIPVEEGLPKAATFTSDNRILVLINEKQIETACYIKARTIKADIFARENRCDYDSTNNIYWIPEGWYLSSLEVDELPQITGNVTHWMPLPEAQEEDA